MHDTKDDEYYVFVTTDTTKTALQIIKAYEMRPRRRLSSIKGFLASGRLQKHKTMPDCVSYGMRPFGVSPVSDICRHRGGKKYAGKFLPVILKNWKHEAGSESAPKDVIVYAAGRFGIFPFIEFLPLYAALEFSIRSALDPIFAFV